MTSCSPALPRRISSEAVRPRRRTAWTGIPSTRPPRPPSSSASLVASGIQPRPASARAFAAPRAVATAVKPEGRVHLGG